MKINEWDSGAENQHVSLKDVLVLVAVSLQKQNSKSKTKDHQDVLSRRLVLWKEDKIDTLLRKGRIIQGRIGKLKESNPPERSKVVVKRILEGQIYSTLSFWSKSSCGGVLALTDEVMTQLKQKHPHPQPAKLGSLLFVPIIPQ